MAPYDLVQMRAAGHAPIYEHPEHGHLRYKLSVGTETIDADRSFETMYKEFILRIVFFSSSTLCNHVM